jgi:transcriptional regulator with XRE-family HTH domain
VADVSPTVRQRELGLRLRKLRTELGWTVEEVGEKLLCSTAKISRLETGARPPVLRDARDLCALYNVDESTTAELMTLTRRRGSRGGGSSTKTSSWTRTWAGAASRSHNRVFGNALLMAGQLGKLLKLATSGKATVQVIPYESGAYTVSDINFTFLEFAEPMLRQWYSLKDLP